VRELNVVGEEPEWDEVAPTLEKLRVLRNLPRVPFPRLRELRFYGAHVDALDPLPPSVETLSLSDTSVLDLHPAAGVAELDLSSRYCVLEGFGRRARVADGFRAATSGLRTLGLGGRVTLEALELALAQSPDLQKLELRPWSPRPHAVRIDLRTTRIRTLLVETSVDVVVPTSVEELTIDCRRLVFDDAARLKRLTVGAAGEGPIDSLPTMPSLLAARCRSRPALEAIRARAPLLRDSEVLAGRGWLVVGAFDDPTEPAAGAALENER